MEPEKICPYMSRPSNKKSEEEFIPCLRERCMAWVGEYRMTPIGLVQAHCRLMGLEGGTVSRSTGVISTNNHSNFHEFD
jgi:hypothetical protein